MRRRGSRGGEAGEPDLTPMLDIVFILLIFFIVTATFIKETAINMTPPPVNEDNPDDNDSEAILVQIDEDNRIFVDNEFTSQSRVAGRIERVRADKPTSPVVVTPNPTAKHGVVVDVYDQAKQIVGDAVILQLEQ